MWNCVVQNIPSRGHKDSAKNNPEVGKSDLTNSGYLKEVLQYRVHGWYKNLENEFRMPINALWFISV